MNSTLKEWNDKGFALTDAGLVKLQHTKGKVKKLANIFTGEVNSVPEVVIGNKKVRNAKKSVVDGVKFDSNLEKYMHGLLRGAQIEFEFQKEYVLQEKFRYNGEAVRAITLTIDFYLPGKNMIIDTKGYANDVAPLKYKMLKFMLRQDWLDNIIGSLPTIELPSTKKECDLLLNRILFEK